MKRGELRSLEDGHGRKREGGKLSRERGHKGVVFGGGEETLCEILVSDFVADGAKWKSNATEAGKILGARHRTQVCNCSQIVALDRDE